MKKVVRDIEKLLQIVDLLKSQDKKVVFTNGGFNILHVGHIRSLREAKKLGDVLVVGINCDSSLQKLKGGKANYHIMPVEERMEVLSAIEYVDYVIPFSETTVDKLLEKLQPHIHAKGTDYTRETVPERDTVLAYGGEIAIVGDPKDHSVTRIFNSLQNSQKQQG